jgi:hypothetical protein
MLSKATHAANACKSGIPRVHIINGRVDEGLLAEVFSNEGIGTLVYAASPNGHWAKPGQFTGHPRFAAVLLFIAHSSFLVVFPG